MSNPWPGSDWPARWPEQLKKKKKAAMSTFLSPTCSPTSQKVDGLYLNYSQKNISIICPASGTLQQ